MVEWTPEAHAYLDGYLKRVAALARQQGDDADEIALQLRDHVDRELEPTAGPIVTLDALLKALAGIGTPEQVVGAEAPPRREAAVGGESARPACAIETPAARGCRCAFSVGLWLTVGFLTLVTVITIVFIDNLNPPVQEDLRMIATSERVFLEIGHLDSDSDGRPDYGSLEELVEKDLLNSSYLSTIRGYRYSVDLTPSSAQGGPDFLVVATPAGDKPGTPITLRGKPEIDGYDGSMRVD